MHMNSNYKFLESFMVRPLQNVCVQNFRMMIIVVGTKQLLLRQWQDRWSGSQYGSKQIERFEQTSKRFTSKVMYLNGPVHIDLINV